MKNITYDKGQDNKVSLTQIYEALPFINHDDIPDWKKKDIKTV